MTISSVALARNIYLPDYGLRTETCRSIFNVLMCKLYIYIYIYVCVCVCVCAVVGVIIEYPDNMHGVTIKKKLMHKIFVLQ